MKKRLFYSTVILCALSFAGMLALYPRLPDTVPVNWNLSGQIDSYGHKSTTLFLGAIPILISLGMYFLPQIDPRRRNYEKFSKAYSIFSFAIPVILACIFWALYLAGLGIKVPVLFFIEVFIGILFVILGNFMPQLRSSFFVGIRTPWALENETVWQKTHRLGGAVFFISGVVMIIGAFLPRTPVFIVSLALLFAGMVCTYIYSYAVYKRLSN